MILALAIFLLCFFVEAQENAIQPHVKNQAYWQYKGKPMWLLGGSDGNP